MNRAAVLAVGPDTEETVLRLRLVLNAQVLRQRLGAALAPAGADVPTRLRLEHLRRALEKTERIAEDLRELAAQLEGGAR